MDSLCGGTMDCLSCLADSRYFVQFRNLTTCCIYNLGNFDVQYLTAFQPGDESLCAESQSNLLSGVLGGVAGVGILVGVGFGFGCWIRNRRLARRLELVERRSSLRDAQVAYRRGGERTRLLDRETDRDTLSNVSLNGSMNDGDRGASSGSGVGSGSGAGVGLGSGSGVAASVGSGSGVGVGAAVSQRSLMSSATQQQQQQQQQLALIPTRSRRSYASTDRGTEEAEEREQMLELSRWLSTGCSVSKSKVTETGGTKVTEKYEMTAL